MSRKSEDYGLEPLTFESAARLLRISEGAFRLWLMERLKPSPKRWSHWETGERELPEPVIRLYLLEQAGARLLGQSFDPQDKPTGVVEKKGKRRAS